MSTIHDRIKQFELNEKPLDEKDLRAIELKFTGHNYKKISEEIGVEYSTVRSWFMAGGKLHNRYTIYSEEEARMHLERARSLFKSSLNKAVQTLIDLLDSNNPRVQFSAAKEILSRELGEPKEHNAEEESEEEIKTITLMKIVKALREKEFKNKS